jgi:hypothetical protein
VYQQLTYIAAMKIFNLPMIWGASNWEILSPALTFKRELIKNNNWTVKDAFKYILLDGLSSCLILLGCG